MLNNTGRDPKSGACCPVSGSKTVDSARAPWSGLRLLAKQLAARGQLRDRCWPNTLVALVTQGQSNLEVEAAGERIVAPLYPGSLVTIPAGYAVKSLAWTGSHEQTIVVFSPEKLEAFELKGRGAQCVRPAARFGFSDRGIEGIMRTMRLEIESGCPSGALFAEAMSLALVARLAADTWKTAPGAAQLKAALTPTQQQRVRDYIAANLTHELALAELAALIDASPGHFTRLFRNTFGVPPYHYIIEQRIDEAKRLMATGQSSILEIALLLGFSSQSHFTVTFRKATGTTPRQFLGNL
jgi:AraC family transcriptional regulator